MQSNVTFSFVFSIKYLLFLYFFENKLNRFTERSLNNTHLVTPKCIVNARHVNS